MPFFIYLLISVLNFDLICKLVHSHFEQKYQTCRDLLWKKRTCTFIVNLDNGTQYFCCNFLCINVLHIEVYVGICVTKFLIIGFDSVCYIVLDS